MDRDLDLEKAVWKAVDRCFMRGRNDETKRHHSLTVLRQVADILNVPLPREQDYQLQKLFGTPFHPSDLPHFLNQYIRKNSIGREKLVKNRDIFILLGVDGFEGVHDLKPYLCYSTQDPHVQGVVHMYQKMDSLTISSLTGTDSACVVFLALLKLFSTHMIDDQIKILTEQTVKRVESFLHRHAHYYQDIRLINEDVLNTLISAYLECNPHWESVAIEKTNVMLKHKPFIR